MGTEVQPVQLRPGIPVYQSACLTPSHAASTFHFLLVIREAVDEGSSVWGPAAHVGKPSELLLPATATVGLWGVSQWTEALSLGLSNK